MDTPMTETDTHQFAQNEQYTVQHDRLEDGSLSVTIATAVATVLGREVTDLEPLHYSIDTDALERLFEPRADGLRDGGTVTFEFSGCLVTVDATGEISVTTTE